MEVEQNNHLSVTRLEERMVNVVVQYVNFVAPHGREPEPYTTTHHQGLSGNVQQIYFNMFFASTLSLLLI